MNTVPYCVVLVVFLSEIVTSEEFPLAEQRGLPESVLVRMEGYLTPGHYERLLGFSAADEDALLPMIRKYRGNKSFGRSIPQFVDGVIDSVRLNEETLRALGEIVRESAAQAVPGVQERYEQLARRIDALISGAVGIEPLQELNEFDREIKILELSYNPGIEVHGWYSRIEELGDDSIESIIARLEGVDSDYREVPAYWSILAVKGASDKDISPLLSERIKALLVGRLLEREPDSEDVKLGILRNGFSLFMREEFTELFREMVQQETGLVQKRASIMIKRMKERGVWSGSSRPPPVESIVSRDPVRSPELDATMDYRLFVIALSLVGIAIVIYLKRRAQA